MRTSRKRTSRKRASRKRTSRRLRRNESTAQQRMWYHGSSKPISKWERGRTFVATDGKEVSMPLWLSPSPEFAALYARGCGSVVYEVPYTPKRIFPEQPILEFVKRGPREFLEETAYGRWLVEEMLSGRLPLLKNVPAEDREMEAYELLKPLDSENYDTMETSAVIEWAKKQGFDSIWVQGDGVRNLMVLDPSEVDFSRTYLQREKCR